MIDKGLIEMDSTLYLTKLRKKIRNFDRTAVYISASSAGMATGGRVLVHYLLTGMITLVFGLIADMLKTQRQIGEEVLYRLKKMKFKNSK